MADNRYDEAIDIIARSTIRLELAIHHPTGGNVLDLPIQAIVDRAIAIYGSIAPGEPAVAAAFDYLKNHLEKETHDE